ncbi:MAG: SPOR domain-containing protein [Gemmatimonadaceae bacterium]
MLLALVLVLGACGPSDRAGTVAQSEAPATSASSRGPDLLVLRFPRAGGIARALNYPIMDSTIWKSSSKVPPISDILAFDDDAGSIVAVDLKGALVRVDLRLGGVGREAKASLVRLASENGSVIYGISRGGLVSRITPSGNDWTFKPPRPAREVFPQPDGSLLVLADAGKETIVWRMFPPMMTITDSTSVPRATKAIGTQIGDRLYFTVDSGLIGVRSSDLSPVPSVRLSRPVRAVATTPSGDRIFIATEDQHEIVVVDRYTEEIDGRIALPGQPGDLRMDERGRYLLVRAAAADSAWVIDIGTSRLLGAVSTAWRDDLPAVAPDGAIALLRGTDVVFVDGEQLEIRRRVQGGASDKWMFIAWNGLRPRAKSLDQPVTFAEGAVPDSSTRDNPFADERPGTDSIVSDTVTQVRPPVEAASAPLEARQATAPANDTSSKAAGFIVQFAALSSEDAAKEAVRSMSAATPRPRVVTTERGGLRIYRVVLGPFVTRSEAERVARASGTSYWIYEGVP